MLSCDLFTHSTHDIAMKEQPPKQLNDVVWKCLDIIIMQSSQTPQPNKLVCRYGLSILWKKTPSLMPAMQYPGKRCLLISDLNLHIPMKFNSKLLLDNHYMNGTIVMLWNVSFSPTDLIYLFCEHNNTMRETRLHFMNLYLNYYLYPHS